jgi:hypothetical protein
MWKMVCNPKCAVFLALLIVSPHDAEANEAPAVSYGFELEGKRYTIELPPGASIKSYPADDKPASDSITIILRPGRRYSPIIRLRVPLDHDGKAGFDKIEPMGNGRTLVYTISASHESGSGEPEAFLDGRMSIGGRPYTVGCSIQDYSITIYDADWCLKPLRTIEPADHPD